MHRNTWKSSERRIAKIFNTHRTPLSGGSSRHTQSDTLHKKLFIEVKHRKKPAHDKLWNDTKQKAKKENKLPILVLLKKGSKEPLILCRLHDIPKINKFIINN